MGIGHNSTFCKLINYDKNLSKFSKIRQNCISLIMLYKSFQVTRHYHGHLSAVYSIDAHPTVDILVTAGRDSTARVRIVCLPAVYLEYSKFVEYRLY